MSSHWHVAVTVAGPEVDSELVRAAMVRLAQERPFLHAMRFARNRAEIRYWDQADNLIDAASLALRVWSEHQVSAALPAWDVVGLEVLEREAYRRRPELSGHTVAVHHPVPQPF
jgi:hypothetical protein